MSIVSLKNQKECFVCGAVKRRKTKMARFKFQLGGNENPEIIEADDKLEAYEIVLEILNVDVWELEEQDEQED
jgi:hypothetical protein